MKRGSGVWLIIAVLFIAFLAFLGFRSKDKVSNIGDKFSAQKDANAIAADIGSCGIIVSDPTPDSVVAFPLTIKTIVDNTDMETRGCAWTVFEAQAGTVKVLDSTNTEVGMGILTTTEDWMTTSAVHYSSQVSLVGTPSGKNLKLVFEEENPSAEGTPDTFIMNVKIP